MLKSLLIAGALALLAGPAAAEVVERSADGFTLRYARSIETSAGDVVLALESIGAWWDGAHTYSGDASNLSIRLEPGACLCERLADGTFFEHGRVILLDDDHLSLNAPLGPLKGRTSRADLTFSWPDANAADVTVIMTFRVEGAGVGAWADGVDAVMQGQYDRLMHYVEHGETPGA
ncbi:SRPBCC domain-containing protein [Brevundimonas sp. M20]|uniref:SRPBCC domain-containing protein n=1 Tax=Brevundimonas sp. M20 TaxID=2591463 RepID=UPI0011473F3A|nr:SRPBCC domain-containing protein [Brevundimonas sp. M20]QDH72136.1 SRPBCC domain-containing protein [Brevundimonas sp. M20]